MASSITAVAAAAATHVAILVGAELSLVQAREHLEISKADWIESYTKRADQEGEKIIEIPLPHPLRGIEDGLRPEKEGMELLANLSKAVFWAKFSRSMTSTRPYFLWLVRSTDIGSVLVLLKEHHFWGTSIGSWLPAKRILLFEVSGQFVMLLGSVGN